MQTKIHFFLGKGAQSISKLYLQWGGEALSALHTLGTTVLTTSTLGLSSILSSLWYPYRTGQSLTVHLYVHISVISFVNVFS